VVLRRGQTDDLQQGRGSVLHVGSMTSGHDGRHKPGIVREDIADLGKEPGMEMQA
jgi:hypothetical protein